MQGTSCPAPIRFAWSLMFQIPLSLCDPRPCTSPCLIPSGRPSLTPQDPSCSRQRRQRSTPCGPTCGTTRTSSCPVRLAALRRVSSSLIPCSHSACACALCFVVLRWQCLKTAWDPHGQLAINVLAPTVCHSPPRHIREDSCLPRPSVAKHLAHGLTPALLVCAVPAFDLPLIDQSNLLLAWANDSSTLVLAFEVRPRICEAPDINLRAPQMPSMVWCLPMSATRGGQARTAQLPPVRFPWGRLSRLSNALGLCAVERGKPFSAT